MNILICDDDKYTRKMLEKLISENPFINKIFTANDGLEAINIASKEDLSIALMDIDMPNLDGIEAAKLINNMIEDIRFVFITGYMDYAIDSFCVHPYDYILKPVDIEYLKTILDKLISIKLKELKSNNKENKSNTFTIKQGQKIILIKKNDILFFEKNNRDILVHTTNKYFILNNMTLSELENKINSNFMRVHQSFIINTLKIRSFENIGNRSYKIEFLKTNKIAYMSRYKFEEFKKKIVTYL